MPTVCLFCKNSDVRRMPVFVASNVLKKSSRLLILPLFAGKIPFYYLYPVCGWLNRREISEGRVSGKALQWMAYFVLIAMIWTTAYGSFGGGP